MKESARIAMSVVKTLIDAKKLKINSGDRLFLYTDGIPEAMNRKEEEYSDERMEKFFNSKRPKKSETFIKNIVNDIRKFSGNTPQRDDITCTLFG